MLEIDAAGSGDKPPELSLVLSPGLFMCAGVGVGGCVEPSSEFVLGRQDAGCGTLGPFELLRLNGSSVVAETSVSATDFAEPREVSRWVGVGDVRDVRLRLCPLDAAEVPAESESSALRDNPRLGVGNRQNALRCTRPASSVMTISLLIEGRTTAASGPDRLSRETDLASGPEGESKAP